MTAENVGQTAGLSVAGFARWGAGPSNRERNFYIALACAALLHASFLISAAQNGGAKRLGSESGADDAISVSLVTEQDLQSRVAMADAVSPPPGPVAPTQEKQPAKPQPQQPPQEQQPPTPPQPEQAKEEPQPPEPQPPPPEPQAQETPQPETAQPDVPQDSDPAKPEEQTVAKAEDLSPDSQPPDLFSLQDEDPSKMQSADKPQPKPKPKQETKHETKKPSTSKPAKKSSSSKSQKKKVAALDFSTQALAPSFSGGGGAAAFQRPPGITRSGLNDAFARAVIRALQQTMPQLSDTLGRVTVKIFLSESGNVVSVKLLSGSKDPSLNQDVVFAAKQTSYPIPPAGSNLADRTFMVTYIYD
jgi:periplasmic protein TonB